MSGVLYGPDGNPMVTTAVAKVAQVEVVDGQVVDGQVDLSKVDRATIDRTITKRVRSQQTSMVSVWDRVRGKPKPTPITWETLRLMGNRNEWIRAIVKTRKNQIGEIEWTIGPRDDGDDASGAVKRMATDQTKLLQHPSARGSRPHSRSWRQFIGEVLEDLLILDAGAIEKERNGKGAVIAMYPVDGATIRPNIDEQGGYYDDAYVQVVDGIVTARFGMEDLVYIMDNPQTDVRFAGYGMSPLENLVLSVTADLYAAKYNASYFEKGAVPEGMLNLGEDVAPEDVDGFRLYWMNEIQGRPWALPIVGGKGVEWVQWRDSHRDMQFMEYQAWLRDKLCAVYQIPPQEIGAIEDVNRSTADSQSDTNRTKSIRPILSLLKDYIDVEVLGQHGQGLGDYLEFKWEDEAEDEEVINARFSVMIDKGAATRNEWRRALGMDEGNEDGLDEYTVTGQVSPLPNKEDLEAGRVTNQQDREDQQKQQELAAQGQGNADMPWKPGDKNDAHTRAAMAQHDQQTGLGPRNADVGKTTDEDRNPALTERAESLEAMFARKQAELRDHLSLILTG